MALFDKLKGELIDIVEWPDQSGALLVHRFPRLGNEIKMNAQLVVRPGQRAVFVNEGKIADRFDTGTHTLETRNLPILATLKGWKYGFHSPFKAEVYFLNATELLDRKWGTPSPVMMRDTDFGVIRLRARGNYAYRVGATDEMISRFVGARDDFPVEAMEGQLRTRIVSSFSDCLGEMKIPALDLLSQYDEIGDAMHKKLGPVFENLGLQMLSFTVENISVPDEVQQAMDQRASMGAIGDLNRFAQYQAAGALRDAASNPGGAGNMMGMMLGGQMAGGMAGVLKQGEQGGQAPAAAGPGPGGAPAAVCPRCSSPAEAGARFCGACGAPLGPATVPCVACGAAIGPEARFCTRCGAPQKATCAKCGGELAAAARFCASCGHPAGKDPAP